MKALPRDPAFCIIAPTPYLDMFARNSTRHLVLAHIVDTNPEYAQFYLDCSIDGHYVIMDNGAFELGESYAPDKLIDLGKKCGADAIVLPDYPGQQSSLTISAAKTWAPQIINAGFKTMFVPQSRLHMLEEWTDCYVWAANNPDIDIIGMSILAIPNALSHIPAAYARVVMTQLLLDRGVFSTKKYHHYLGLNAGPKLEIPALMNMHALYNWSGFSCDSSNPVWMAILGHEYSHTTDSYLPVKKIHKAVDFDYPLEKKQETLNRIAHNIGLTLELFK